MEGKIYTSDRYDDKVEYDEHTSESLRDAVKLWSAGDTGVCERYGPIEDWQTYGVCDMSDLFFGNKIINHALDWDLDACETTARMFHGASNYNQPITFDMNGVENISGMFEGATSFDQPLSWNTQYVTDMSRIFYGATRFNQPLKWDVSRVEYMHHAFWGATAFDQTLDWDTSSVDSMVEPHLACSDFVSGDDIFVMCAVFIDEKKRDPEKVRRELGVFTGTAFIARAEYTEAYASQFELPTINYYNGGADSRGAAAEEPCDARDGDGGRVEH